MHTNHRWLQCHSSSSVIPHNNNNNHRQSQLTFLFVLTTLAVFMQMPDRSTAAPAAAIDSAENSFALTDSLQALAPHSGHSSSHRRQLHKRQHNLLLAKLASATEHQLQWQNACNGHYVGERKFNTRNPKQQRVALKQHMKALRRTAHLEYQTLKAARHTIDISDIRSWRRHRSKFRFLPQMKRNSTFKARRWHRSLQKFVASFAFLGSTQYRWDMRKLQTPSNMTRELNDLLLSAKRVLCELEHAINGSLPHSGERQLTLISQAEMDRQLHFYSRDKRSAAAQGAHPTDLKFAKHRYYNYLLRMSKTLSGLLRRQTGAQLAALFDASSGESANASKASASAELDLSAIFDEGASLQKLSVGAT